MFLLKIAIFASCEKDLMSRYAYRLFHSLR
jgi:hypothetical protein